MGKRTAFIATALALLPGGALFAAAPPSGGTIAVRIVNVAGGYGSSMQAFVDGAAEALAAKGFTMLEDPEHAAYVAELTLSREDVGTSRAEVPGRSAAILPGASYGAGVGVTVPLSTGRSSLVPLQRIRTELRIRARGHEDVAWHGAAITVRPADGRGNTDKRTAVSLSEAVLRAYPAESSDVVGVP